MILGPTANNRLPSNLLAQIRVVVVAQERIGLNQRRLQVKGELVHAGNKVYRLGLIYLVYSRPSSEARTTNTTNLRTCLRTADSVHLTRLLIHPA